MCKWPSKCADMQIGKCANAGRGFYKCVDVQISKCANDGRSSKKNYQSVSL